MAAGSLVIQVKSYMYCDVPAHQICVGKYIAWHVAGSGCCGVVGVGSGCSRTKPSISTVASNASRMSLKYRVPMSAVTCNAILGFLHQFLDYYDDESTVACKISFTLTLSLGPFYCTDLPTSGVLDLA